METKSKIVAIFVALLAITAIAATKGDTPAAQYGNISVGTYDGGNTSPTAIPMMNGQNTMAIFNNGILDGGTSTKVFCGWDKNVTPVNGMPVGVGVLLNIDIVSVCTSPIPADGGATVCNPQLYCVGVNSGLQSGMDVRHMRVK